ncbi:MAG: elongation factor P, partial [Bacteroidota bacterium]
MASTADFRNGMCIKYNNDLFSIVEFQHVKPGKGPAFVRTKLKSVTTGKVIENTFPSGAKVETARIERRPYQFLYNDDLGFHFMHKETFEQLTLQEDLITYPKLLKESEEVEILFHDETETPLRCELPQFVEMEIT